ncbi:protein FAM83A [Polyodon spathula]|uniref:protein FAM83A n=1 Tax=Polyodon spathula TaxID=7913 RepID=UPI001B7F3C70|nr:protein FAM83A [Polyodon spathula]
MNPENRGRYGDWHGRAKPVGKMKKRLQEVKYQSYKLSEVDLSHNESARLATDALMDKGSAAFHEVLAAEGEVDFLSAMEKEYILRNVRMPQWESESQAEEEKGIGEIAAPSVRSDTYFPTASDSDAPVLDYGWPMADKQYYLKGKPNAEVHFQTDSSRSIKDILREYISKATTVLAIVMDVFSDVEIFCDLLEATNKRNVSVYLLLDHRNLHHFTEMCEKLQINSSHLTKVSIRTVSGEVYCAKSGRKFSGQIKEKFVIIDCSSVLAGSYSFSWLSGQVHRNLVVLFTGCIVKLFDVEFRQLYAISKPVTDLCYAASDSWITETVSPTGTRFTNHQDFNPHSEPCTTLSGYSGPTIKSQPQGAVECRFQHIKLPVTSGHQLNNYNYMPPPRAQWVPQMHHSVNSKARQRSFFSDYGKGVQPMFNNVFGMLLGQQEEQFPRWGSGIRFFNKPDLLPC